MEDTASESTSARKTSARKRAAPGTTVKSLTSKAKHHNAIFDDHAGKPAMMSWSHSAHESSIPPLSSWVFYMTHPDFSFTDFDGHDFILKAGSNSAHSGGRFRTEFFCLPGATPEECVEHFRGELEARGSTDRQVHKVHEAKRLKKTKVDKNPDNDDSEPNTEEQKSSDEKSQENTELERLPGLVWPAAPRDYKHFQYRGWFWIYPDVDVAWGPEHQDRQVNFVKFDPVPNDPSELDEGEHFLWDPMEEPVKVLVMGQWQEIGSWTKDTGHMMSDIAHHKKWEEANNEAYNDAVEMGWESW